MADKIKPARSRQQKTEQGHQSRATGGAGEAAVSMMFGLWGWRPIQIGSAIDQGADFIVEYCEKGLGMGFHFFVSAKATTSSTKIQRPFITEGLRKNAVDYILRQRMPVFLMKVRVADGCLYWVDLKEAIRRDGRSKGGGFQAHLPLTNRLSIMGEERQLSAERDAFKKELEKADAGWQPPKVRAIDALHERERELEDLDERCRVSVTVSGKHERIEVYANTPIHLKSEMVPANESEAAKLKETLSFGTQNDIGLDRFALQGSKLLEHLIPQNSSGLMRIGGHSVATRVVLLGAPKEPNGSTERMRFKGPITRGLGGAEIKAESDDSPLSIRLRADDKTGKQSFSLNLGVQTWEGKSIDGMHGLTKAASVLTDIARTKTVCISFPPVLENKTISLRFSDSESERLAQCAGLLRRLDDLREILRLYGKTLSIGRPESWVIEEVSEWTAARRLLEGKVLDRGTVELEFSFDPSENLTALADGKADRFVVTQIDFGVYAFGEKVCSFLIDLLIIDYAIQVNTENSGEVALSITPKPESRLYIRRSSLVPFVEPS